VVDKGGLRARSGRTTVVKRGVASTLYEGGARMSASPPFPPARASAFDVELMHIVDTGWMLMCTTLIIFMQGGFILVR